MGLPGMGTPDPRKEPHQTLRLLPGGKMHLFAHRG